MATQSSLAATSKHDEGLTLENDKASERVRTVRSSPGKKAASLLRHKRLPILEVTRGSVRPSVRPLSSDSYSRSQRDQRPGSRHDGGKIRPACSSEPVQLSRSIGRKLTERNTPGCD